MIFHRHQNYDKILSDSAEEVIVELERYRSLDVNYEILFARALKFLHEQIINTVKESSGLNQDMNLFFTNFFKTVWLMPNKQIAGEKKTSILLH